jgi:DNA polymerase III subunit beta
MSVLDDDLDVLSWLDSEESVRPVIEVKTANTASLTSIETTGTSFEINREVLLGLLNKCIGVVPTRDMIPVLTNFQFQLYDGKLKVVASSLEMSITAYTTQVDIKTEGTEVFPAKVILNIAKEANTGSNIFIEVTPAGAVIVSGSFSSEIRLIQGKDFPVLESIETIDFHEVDRQKFVDAITKVKYALPGRDYSGQASMKMISIKNGKFTTCDGSRFQQVRLEDFKLSMQLGAESIPHLTKMLTASDHMSMFVGETKNKLVFKLDNLVFYVNKLESPYPNVEQLWLRPALSNDQALSVNRQELITAIKQVRLASDPNENAIGLIIDSGEMKLIAKDTNASSQVTIPCKWDGKPKNIVVNYMHLAEMLKVYTQAECTFMLGEDTTKSKPPILLRDDEATSLATISQMLAYRVGLG